MPTMKQRGDRDISPQTGPVHIEKGVVPPPGSPYEHYQTGDIAKYMQNWIASETKRLGRRPTTGAIARERNKFSESIEVKPTPEADIGPETRIRGA